MRTFTIPSTGNEITESDIETGVLRITIEFKEYFPSESGELVISYGRTLVKKVPFEYRDGRSHRLKVGRAFMINLGLNSLSRLRFRVVIPKEHFLIEKV